MPSDIRSFFGGKPPAVPKAEPKVEKQPAKKGRGSRKVIVDDSDEEDHAPTTKKSTPVKPAKRARTPEGEDTTTSEYFGNSKPKRSEPVRSQPSRAANGTSPVKTPAKTNGTSHAASKKTEAHVTPKKTETRAPITTPASTRSTRAKPKQSYAEDLNEDDFPDDLEEDELDGLGKSAAASTRAVAKDQNNIPKMAPSTSTPAKSKPAKPASAKSTPAKSTAAATRSKRSQAKDVDYEEEDVDMLDNDDPEDDFVVPTDDEEVVKNKPVKGTKTAASNKRKAIEIKNEDEEEADPTPKKRGRKTSNATSKKKQEPVEDSAEIQSIMSSIPTVRPPTPPPRDEETGKHKFDFRTAPKNSAAPAGQGSKEIPEGAENCLAGLTFVFTGLLDTLQRDDGLSLVKRYGGKVTTAPSKNTSFVVLGNDAGPSKLKKIRDNGLKTINEDGLFELIRRLPANGGDSKAAAKHAEKTAKQEGKLQKQAALMEQEAQEAAAAAEKTSSSAATAGGKGKGNVPDTRLWTVKYAPTQLNQICGNKALVEKLQKWLRSYPKSQRSKFKLPGPDGSGTFRAVIIHGPPGIGKTTAAHLVAKSEGYDIVESNASDTRSKKLVETGLTGVLDTRSLAGYFAGDGKQIETSKKKLCLIMDEVDGMSAGDRGGVGAMAAVCKKANIPIILICNDRKLPKMKPFDSVAYDLPFRRPTTDMIRARIMTILYREKMTVPANVVNALIEGTGADIRQIVNMVSTAKLDNSDMDYEGGKSMSKAWEKHVILKPWDIVGKILGGGMFATASKSTLNDKIELYFNDHEFSYLMLQENYLGTAPIRAQNMEGKKRKLELLKLASKAADSISDGDLVDRMIHGSQQQWSLMPAHAVFSFVRPASFVSGSLAYNGTKFTSWLGQNSAQGKLVRFVKEIQGHMRLRTTGDRHEVRQQYMPLLWQELINRLQKEGKEAIDEIIALMDSYYLTRDDFDAIMELGVGPHKMSGIKIETQDKSAFTREYNKRDHPLPFIKASNVQAPKKLSKDKPDLEEAIEESDEGEVIDVKDEDDEEDFDLSKDKYVKQPKKKKAAPASKDKASKKVKTEDDDETSEAEKPKRGKGKATRGRGKK